MDGTVNQVIRFERHFDQPVDAVWAALTQPQWVAQWLAVVETDEGDDRGRGLRQEGRVALRFQNTGFVVSGRVSRLEAPYVLEYAIDNTQFPEAVPREALR